MSFLHRVAGHTLRDRVGSSVTQEELGVEPLLHHVERSQLRWLRHLFWSLLDTSLGQTKDTLEGLCLSACLGTPRDPHRQPGGAPTDPPPPSGMHCALWESVGRRGCVCKMPAQCQLSLPLCASIGPLKQVLGLCQLGALRCLGRGFSLISDQQCVWEEPSCRDCGPGTKCDESADKCICQKVSDCPPGSALLCATYGNKDVAVTTSECEVGARRCAGEQVNVTSIEACPDH